MATWREYCRRVQQFRSEFALQKKIQTYEAAPHHSSTSDLPPELAAAVAAEAEAQMAARAATPTIMPHQSPAQPQQQVCLQHMVGFWLSVTAAWNAITMKSMCNQSLARGND